MYTYDANSRLSSANYPGKGLTSHAYDWVGNQTSLSGSQYNAADQLTARTGHTYTYDGRGNLYQDTGGTTKTYACNQANLLLSVTDSSNGTTTMTWDASGNRVKFTSSSDTNNPYYFVYDITAGIPATVEENHDSTSTYYIREPGGALIARTWYSGGVWQYQYYHFDDMGSTILLTNGDGAITDSYAYDAWGKSMHTGSTNQPYQYIGRLGYYSHYQDSNMGGLLQLGVRFYDPQIGRFTQRDPVKEPFNLYTYAVNNPMVAIDPWGLKSWRCTNPKPPGISRMKWLEKVIQNFWWCYGCLLSCYDFCNDIPDCDESNRCATACAAEWKRHQFGTRFEFSIGWR